MKVQGILAIGAAAWLLAAGAAAASPYNLLSLGDDGEAMFMDIGAVEPVNGGGKSVWLYTLSSKADAQGVSVIATQHEYDCRGKSRMLKAAAFTEEGDTVEAGPAGGDLAAWSDISKRSAENDVEAVACRGEAPQVAMGDGMSFEEFLPWARETMRDFLDSEKR